MAAILILQGWMESRTTHHADKQPEHETRP
jgi:hypothetical protein